MGGWHELIVDLSERESFFFSRDDMLYSCRLCFVLHNLRGKPWRFVVVIGHYSGGRATTPGIGDGAPSKACQRGGRGARPVSAVHAFCGYYGWANVV